MKKWLAISLALLFALAMTVPAMAQDPTPTATPIPTPAKMQVTIDLADHQQSTHVISGHIQCTTIEGDFYDLSSGGVSFETNDFTCLGEVTWSVSYGYGGSHHSAGGSEVSVFDTDPFYYDSDFQTNGDNVPLTYDYPQLNGSGIAPTTIHPENGYGITQGGYGHTGEDLNIVNYLYIHDSTKHPCNTEWDVVSTVASGAIDATNETGVAATLIVTNEYKLTVWGGPWNDGSADRYDTALKIGTDNWTPLGDFGSDPNGPMDCSQGDPLDPNKVTLYFHATEVDWKIRVNDLVGEFANNTGAMQFQLDLVQPHSPSGCQNQFLRGTMIASGSIPATSSVGVHPDSTSKENPYYAGNWIEIVTSGGPWQDSGVPPNRYDIAIKNKDGTWSELTAAADSSCTTTNGYYITAWYQLPNSDGVYLRVNDSGGTFTNNTGSMGYSLYNTTYSPIPPSGCAELYQLGDLIKSVDAPATSQNGVKVGTLFSPKEVGTQEYYAIETSGVWIDNSAPEVWGALAAASSTPMDIAWSDISTWPGASCAVMLDPIGHWRIYVPVDSNANNYWVRAQEYLDNTWANNSGNLTFKFFKAIYARIPNYEPGPMPAAGICDPYYTKGVADAAVHILGNNQDGVALPSLTSGKIYAVETSAGPWSNNGDNSYEVAISEDDGVNWHNLSAWASATCAQSADGLHILLYFQALAGRHYKLRVYDPEASFSDNSGHMDYLLYENVVVANSGNCADNYTLQPISVSNPIIPSGNPGGVKISLSKELKPTDVFAIEISADDYWAYIATPDEHHSDALISSDNGSTWDVFGPGLAMSICTVQTKEESNGEAYEQLYRIYFNPPNGTLKMRLNQNFDNVATGDLKYLLYGTKPKEPVPCKECDNPLPPDWQAECYENYLRPNYLFKLAAFQLPDISFGSLGSITFPVFSVPLPAVDDWIAYLQWTVRSYFAWCPEHTAALAAIPTSFDNYEPFGTITEVNTTIDLLNEKLDQFKESGGESTYTPYSVIFSTGGGESGSANWQGLLPIVGADSPWAWSGSGPLTTHIGENVTFDPNTAALMGGEANYVDYCEAIFDAHFGVAVGTAMCFMTNVARTVPFLWIVIQLGVDVGSVVGIVAYIQKRWIDPRMSA